MARRYGVDSVVPSFSLFQKLFSRDFWFMGGTLPGILNLPLGILFILLIIEISLALALLLAGHWLTVVDFAGSLARREIGLGAERYAGVFAFVVLGFEMLFVLSRVYDVVEQVYPYIESHKKIKQLIRAAISLLGVLGIPTLAFEVLIGRLFG